MARPWPPAYAVRIMALTWKRWTAIVLLALTSAAASASVCAALCTDYDARGTSAPMIVDAESAMPADCPMAQLCEFAVTPAVLGAVHLPDLAAAVYVAPLTLHRPYQSDAEPPLKPPAI